MGMLKHKWLGFSIPAYFYFLRYPFLPQFSCGKCSFLIKVPDKFNGIHHEWMCQWECITPKKRGQNRTGRYRCLITFFMHTEWGKNITVRRSVWTPFWTQMNLVYWVVWCTSLRILVLSCAMWLSSQVQVEQKRWMTTRTFSEVSAMLADLLLIDTFALSGKESD